MPTRKAVAQKEPTLAPHRALKALSQQLEVLQKLKNRGYQEDGAEETIPQLDDWSRSRRLHLLFLERIGTTYFRPWQL